MIYQETIETENLRKYSQDELDDIKDFLDTINYKLYNVLMVFFNYSDDVDELVPFFLVKNTVRFKLEKYNEWYSIPLEMFERDTYLDDIIDFIKTETIKNKFDPYEILIAKVTALEESVKTLAKHFASQYETSEPYETDKS